MYGVRFVGQATQVTLNRNERPAGSRSPQIPQ